MKQKLLALAAAVSLIAGVTVQAADTVKIGLMAPLTGSWASEGQGMKKIVELLAEQQNAKGGVLGKQIEVITEDDGGDPRTASLAAQRLTTKGVAAVVGTYGSSVTEASQAIYDEAKIPQIANGSTAIRLTEKGFKHFFRTAPRDDEQGRMAAQTIGKLGFKKVAILHDSTSYAKGLADEVQRAAEERKVRRSCSSMR
jgi:branched-chain amino acid transport system substrate-binding protein